MDYYNYLTLYALYLMSLERPKRTIASFSMDPPRNRTKGTAGKQRYPHPALVLIPSLM